MTREFHPESHVESGDKADRLGHETSDAPVGRVLWVTAAFGLLLFIGIGVGVLLQGSFGRPSPVAPLAPLPARLLVDAPVERRRIETAAKRHVDEARLRGAMRGAATQGWDPTP